MARINFTAVDQVNSADIDLNQGETVLDGLLRTGHDIPYGCRAGVCQSCLMQCSSDNIPDNAQLGLKESQKQLGYFLACSCVPDTDMEVSTSNIGNKKVTAKVILKDYLTSDVLRLRIEKVFDYKPGQFCTLWKDDKVARCYSIASVPQNESFLEFHIKKIPSGIFSAWVCDEITVGDSIAVQGPMGECFYTAGNTSQMLFLAGIGTGLAPLYGIVRDALRQDHNGKINLIVAAKKPENFYLINELIELENKYKQLTIHFISQTINKSVEKRKIIQADIYEYVKSLIPDFKDQRVFLCGAESFVQKMKRQCFMQGANMPDISADAFLAFKN